MRVMILGASGMLGREVVKARIASDPRSMATAIYRHSDLDITDTETVRFVLDAHRPDVVINCAGLTKHRVPEPTREEYMFVNAVAPRALAYECERVGARLIHVSTDCVFSGARPIADGPYTERDTPDATDDYGASKAAGEVTRAPHLTVRCSFVGNGNRGLIAWLRAIGGDEHHTAAMRLPIQLWTRAYWSGSTAPAIARALVELAERPEVTGLMHLTDGVRHTKAELIDEIYLAGLARPFHVEPRDEPVINRWLVSVRDDVPALPPLDVALRELAR